MSTKILVTFASKYGSTQGVAEAITEVLQNKGYTVDLIPSKEVKNLDEYQAVVLGTPLYAGSLLSEATKFLSRFMSQLDKTPSAFFVLGPLGKSADEMHGVQVQLATNRKKFAWYKPVEIRIFVGALDLKKLRFPDSIIKLYRSDKKNPMSSSDERDWKAIQNWAAALPESLHLVK